MADIPEYPSSRSESYLAKIAGQDVELPNPVSRIDQYLLYIAENGGGGGGSGTTNYNNLLNKPKINGVTLTGDKTPEDLGLVKEIEITTSSTTWALQHNLNTKTPSIECLDNNSVPIGGEIDYKNATINYIEVTFCKPIQGKAIIRK